MYENVQKTIKNYKKLLQNYFGDIEVEKHKSHQNNSPIAINNVHTKKLVVSQQVSFVKKTLNIFMVTMMLKNLDLSPYFFKR